jgi:hypothetical protein
MFDKGVTVTRSAGGTPCSLSGGLESRGLEARFSPFRGAGDHLFDDRGE